MVITRTPYRVSFFGGGTDYPPWFKQHGGAVLSTTINKFCHISMRRLPPFFEHRYRLVWSKVEAVSTIDQIEHPAARAVLQWAKVAEGLEVHHDGDLPARSGVGSSSSFTVGMVHAVKAHRGEIMSREALADAAIHLEQDVLKEPVGCQDQIAAAFGGFNRIYFDPSGAYRVAPMTLPSDRVAWLESHLMLFFSGISRYSAAVARSKVENLAKKERELGEMRQMVDHAVEILTQPSRSVVEFGKLLHDAWMLKRELSDKVSTPEVDAIYQTGREAGALGGKLLGAGGGGFVLLFVEPPNRKRVQDALSHLIHVPFRFENQGSTVVSYRPDEA